MSGSSAREPESLDQMHKRVVVKDDGRKLYSYTFGEEPDPFQVSDGSLIAEVKAAPSAPAEESKDV